MFQYGPASAPAAKRYVMRKMKSINLTVAIAFAFGVCVGCATTKELDYGVTSLAVLPISRSVIFVFSEPTDYGALVIREVHEEAIRDLSSYLSLHGMSIIKATTYAEIRDVKYMRSPEYSGKSYHVSITLDRPLAPGEFGRGFSLDGRLDHISLIGEKEAQELLSQDLVVRVDSVPHQLHYTSSILRWPGRSQRP